MIIQGRPYSARRHWKFEEHQFFERREGGLTKKSKEKRQKENERNPRRRKWLWHENCSLALNQKRGQKPNRHGLRSGKMRK